MSAFRWHRFSDNGKGFKIQIIGSKNDRPEVTPYVRFEGPNGEYLGSLSGHGVRSLRAQLRKAFDDES